MALKNSNVRIRTLLFVQIFMAALASAQKLDSIPPSRPEGAALPVDTTLSAIQNHGKLQADTAQAPRDSLAKVVAEKPGFVKKALRPVGNFFKKDYPNPRKAMFLSLCLPGAGQAYNKSFWKLPLVYGAYGGMIWLEYNNLTYYRELKTAYYNKVNDLPVDPKYAAADAQTLKFYRDQARRNFDLSSILLGLTHLLATAEAFVDAHLSRFDVSDDLSLKVKPSFIPNGPQSGVMGIGFSMYFSGN